MWLDWGPLPPIRRGLLMSPLREWQARRSLESSWSERVLTDRDFAPGRPGLFVSLTSHRPRFENLAATLRSLLLQNLQPEAVLLWISEADSAFIPPEVSELVAFGLCIEVCEDHGPHTKYHHALARYPEADIAICDDDTCYPPDWLEKLVAARRDDAIACHRAHRVVLDGDGTPKGYRYWEHDIVGPSLSPRNFGTGVGGMLLRAGLFDPSVLDIEAAMALSPTADDLWLYFTARTGGTSFYQSGWTTPLVTWSGSQGSALWRRNVAASGNDASLRRLLDHFGRDIALPEGATRSLAA